MDIRDTAQAMLSAVVARESAGNTKITVQDLRSELGIEETSAGEVARYLVDKSLLIGIGGGASSAPRLVRSTTEGKIHVQEGRHLKDADRTTTTQNNINIGGIYGSGSHNIAIADNVHQEMSVGVSSEDIAELIAALKEVGREDLAGEVAAATDNGRKPGRVGKALAVIIPALTAAGELAGVAQMIGGFF